MKKQRFENSVGKVKLAFALLAAGLVLGACKKEEPAKRVMPPAPVVLAKAEQKDAFRFINSLGTTRSFKSTVITPQVSGQLVSINFNQGDYVKEGDILAVIDKRPYEAEVLAAHAQLVQAQAKLKIDQLAVDRNKKLAESNYVDSQTYDSLVAAVDADKGAVEAAQAALDLAKINLDWCTIKAPISGKVGLYNINVGNVVSAGVSSITSIEQLEKLYVDFIIPTQDLFRIKELMKKRGGKLDIEVSYLDSAYSGQVRKATVSIFENRTRYESSTTVLCGEIDNKDGFFAAPQAVKVRLLTEEVKGGVFIPDSAIQNDVVGPYIYAADKLDDIIYKIRKVYVNKIQQFPDTRQLVTGAKDGDGAQHEIKGGEMVVQSGHLKVAAGAYAYSAIMQGAPIGADGKPIMNPQEIGKFMQSAIQAKAKYEAESMPAPQTEKAPEGKEKK